MSGLDEITMRLTRMDSFNVYAIVDGEVEPWYEVTGDIVRELVIVEQDMARQVQAIGGQIAHWGRHAARCERILAIEERKYRRWRSEEYLERRKGKPRPTEKEIEAGYRTHADYARYQSAIERAKEAVASSRAIVEGFKAKRDMLRATVRRNRESNQPELSV